MHNVLPDFGHDDVPLGAASLVLCTLTVLILVRLLCQAPFLRSTTRAVWLILAATLAGNGIWATHLLVMMSYHRRNGPCYDLPLTVLSMMTAIFLLAASSQERITKAKSLSPIQPLLMTAAVGSLHYAGLAAMDGMDWTSLSPLRIGVSLGTSLAFFYLGSILLRRQHGAGRALATIPWVMGIMLLHMLGMPDRAVSTTAAESHPLRTMPLSGMAAIGVTTFLVLATLCLWLGFVAIRRIRHETSRSRNFADMAMEGLIVAANGPRIIDTNMAFRTLVGRFRRQSSRLADYLPDLATDDMLHQVVRQEKPRETWLNIQQGEAIPVEVHARTAVWRGRTRTILAIVDLRPRKQTEETLRTLSFQDPLTGVGNRASFLSGLTPLLQRTHAPFRVAVLLIDIDRFKNINETCGHAAGDRILAHIARTLSSLAPQDALIARIAGDEFAIAFATVRRDIESFAVWLTQDLAQSAHKTHNILPLSVCVGFTLSDSDMRHGETLLHRADVALFAAKQTGRGSTRAYDPGFDASIQKRLQMEGELRTALDREEFFLEYQPIMSTRGYRLTGYEALLRWNHPEHGVVFPDQFIPVAEESGLISELGAWVIREACREAANWPDTLDVSINVSPLQFSASDLPAIVMDATSRVGLSPGQVNIEITEHVLLRHELQNMEVLHRLRSLGVGIVMDDFGTGYSSLSYLRDFSFDRVKIDRSFVKDMLQKPHAAAIVETILLLGQGLGMDIVAEGIETRQQLAYFEKHACALVQGYLIGPPSRMVRNTWAAHWSPLIEPPA